MLRTFKWAAGECGDRSWRRRPTQKRACSKSTLTKARALYARAVARRWLRAATSALLLIEVGCGHPLYIARAAQASAELTRAEQLDAAERAPYEYYYALEHLRQARSEGLDADYAEATALAQVAFDYASRAIQIAQRVGPAPPAASAGVP